MESKREYADWIIAAIHFVVAWFIVPLLVGWIYSFTLSPYIIGISTDFLNLLLTDVIRMLAVWLGVVSSAFYLSKYYAIKNTDNIIKQSLEYAIVWSLLMIVLLVSIVTFSFTSFEYLKYNLSFFVLYMIAVIIDIVIFYFASKKYVISNEKV